MTEDTRQKHTKQLSMLAQRLQRIGCCVKRYLRTGSMIPTLSAADMGDTPQRCAPPSLDVVPPAILYLSEDYVLIDKPCDVRMDGDFPVTVEKLIDRWVTDATGTQPELRLIHQLDFATSGVLCMGLTKSAT